MERTTNLDKTLHSFLWTDSEQCDWRFDKLLTKNLSRIDIFNCMHVNSQQPLIQTFVRSNPGYGMII